MLMMMLMMMQVMLRMEETRRIRMKQRADKWKEQVTVYIIIKFLLKKCLRGTGALFPIWGDFFDI